MPIVTEITYFTTAVVQLTSHLCVTDFSPIKLLMRPVLKKNRKLKLRPNFTFRLKQPDKKKILYTDFVYKMFWLMCFYVSVNKYNDKPTFYTSTPCKPMCKYYYKCRNEAPTQPRSWHFVSGLTQTAGRCL